MRRQQQPQLGPEQRAMMSPLESKTPGSAEWCYQVVGTLIYLWKSKELSIKQWNERIEELEKHRAWEKVPPGNPYGSMDALLKATIGMGVEEAEQKLGKRGGDRRSKEARENQGANGTLKRGSNSVEYKLARLRRDRPELATEVDCGEMTVAAAWRAAGLEKERDLAREALRQLELAGGKQAVQVSTTKAAQKHGGKREKEKHMGESHLKGGNSSEARIARLKRDYPAIADALAQGEFKNVAAAWRAAGLEKPKDAFKEAARWWSRMDREQRARFQAQVCDC